MIPSRLSGKAEKAYRIVDAVKLNNNIFGVRVIVKKEADKYKVEGGEYTQFRAYDVTTKKEPIFSSTSGNSSSKEQGSNQPLLNIDSSNVSIRELLKQVNDWQGHPYVNLDGTPNYGIYFGDNETGGVMYITPKDTTYEQRAWHGSSMDFDTFDLGKVGTGSGAAMHGWGIYTAKKIQRIHRKNLCNNIRLWKKAGTYGQPITNMDIQLDKPAPVITIKEKYAGMDWKDLRKQLPGTVENDIVSPKNEQGEYIPYVNKVTKRKIIVTKNSIDHFKSDHTSNKDAAKNRQTTLHYEMIKAIPDIIRKGIWIEEHQDYHGKVPGIVSDCCAGENKKSGICR